MPPNLSWGLSGQQAASLCRKSGMKYFLRYECNIESLQSVIKSYLTHCQTYDRKHAKMVTIDTSSIAFISETGNWYTDILANCNLWQEMCVKSFWGRDRLTRAWLRCKTEFWTGILSVIDNIKKTAWKQLNVETNFKNKKVSIRIEWKLLTLIHCSAIENSFINWKLVTYNT